MNNLTTFYLVRHGETEDNVNHIIQGHTDSPLTQNGIDDIKKVAKKFKGIDFDLVFSSDLLRAKRTAEIIVLEHKLEVKVTQLIRERNFGEFEGKHDSEYAKVNDILENLTIEERRAFDKFGMESENNLVERLMTFIREVAVANPGKKVLVVAHGAIIRYFLIRLGVGNYQNFRGRSIKNGGFAKIETDGTDFFVKELSGIQFVN
jgi:broad specificity phosphatase PhoE